VPDHIDGTSGSPSRAHTIPDDPLPRQTPLAFRRIDWPVSRTVVLPPPVPPPINDFATVMAARYSSRRIRRTSLRETANFLAFACAVKSTWGVDSLRSSRPAHSAGALHPVEVLLVAGGRRDRVFRINPLLNAIQSLRTQWTPPLKSLDAKLAVMLPHARSDYLVLLADPAVTDSYYFDPQSLIWRDAGALMQTLHFCATAYRLALCPAGITGTELAAAIFGADSRLIGAGVAVIGRQAEG
jgi:hypothetical protein